MTFAPIPLAGVLQTAERPSAMTGIYDHWLATTGLPGRFVPMTVAPEDLGDVIATLPKAGFIGLNITRPYQQIPFQYSVHVQHEPSGETTHREYLADVSGDPRPELVEPGIPRDAPAPHPRALAEAGRTAPGALEVPPAVLDLSRLM